MKCPATTITTEAALTKALRTVTRTDHLTVALRTATHTDHPTASRHTAHRPTDRLTAARTDQKLQSYRLGYRVSPRSQPKPLLRPSVTTPHTKQSKFRYIFF